MHEFVMRASSKLSRPSDSKATFLQLEQLVLSCSLDIRHVPWSVKQRRSMMLPTRATRWVPRATGGRACGLAALITTWLCPLPLDTQAISLKLCKVPDDIACSRSQTLVREATVVDCDNVHISESSLVPWLHAWQCGSCQESELASRLGSPTNRCVVIPSPLEHSALAVSCFAKWSHSQRRVTAA